MEDKVEKTNMEQVALETGLVEPENGEMAVHVDPAVPGQDKSAQTVLEVGGEKAEAKKKLPVTIDARDYMFLRKSGYEEQRKKWNKTFILQHMKYPDKIVELRAASAYHACRMIHWKPNQVRLLSEKTEPVADVIDNVKKMSMEHTKRQMTSTALV